MGWWVCGLGSPFMSIWHALPGVISWGLWRERNNMIFEDKFRSQDEVVVAIYKSLFEWASVWAIFEDGEWDTIWSEEL